MKKDLESSATVMVVLTALAVVAGGVIWSGYVLSILWAWFLVPALGAPALSVAQAMGVTLTARMVTGHASGKDDSEKTNTEKVMGLAQLFVKPLVILCVGWVVKQWVPA